MLNEFISSRHSPWVLASAMANEGLSGIAASEQHGILMTYFKHSGGTYHTNLDERSR
jgi:hypothetical protein